MLTEINYKGDIIMEQMGIVRRLDALGRVVIPREFRKLNRIEVGDPLEIRALANGDILVRKVDLSAQLRSIGAIALSSLAPHTHNTVGVCTPEEWLMFSAAVLKAFKVDFFHFPSGMDRSSGITAFSGSLNTEAISCAVITSPFMICPPFSLFTIKLLSLIPLSDNLSLHASEHFIDGR